jgi:RNA polymerase sigma-70 factor (ECF subfamily)
MVGLLLTERQTLLSYARRHLPADVARVIGPEDVFQDVLVAALRRIAGFVATDDASARRWLLTIARHRIAEVVRSCRAQKRGGGQAAEGAENEPVLRLLAEVAVYERTPSQSALSHELVAAVQEAVCRLPADYGMAIRLRYVQGLSVADAARAMDRTEGALMTICCRALKMLRQEMGALAAVG